MKKSSKNVDRMEKELLRRKHHKLADMATGAVVGGLVAGPVGIVAGTIAGAAVHLESHGGSVNHTADTSTSEKSKPK